MNGWQTMFDFVSDFAESFMAGEHPRIEDFVGKVQHWSEIDRTTLTLQLVETEIDLREHRGEQITDHDRVAYGERFPLLQIQQRYLLQRVLGHGGFGVVYRAWDRQTNQQIALKKLRDETRHDKRSELRFAAERKAVSTLVHPHIVQFLDAGREAKSCNFICYELIEGKTLKDLVQPLPSEQVAANWTRDIARAIDYAHRHGVIHRDLKPGNIMLDQVRGRVKVLDFGIAKLDPEHFTEAVLGPTGSAPPPGTWLWMAPEQHRGLADKRSDVHAIGSILYYLLTGQPPLDSTWRRPPGQPPPFPTLLRDRNPNISRHLERICFHALAFNPDERYQTAGELADDLDRFLTGKPVKAPKVRIPRAVNWKRLSLICTAAMALAMLAVGVYGAIPKRVAPGWISLPGQHGLDRVHWNMELNDLHLEVGQPSSPFPWKRITKVQSSFWTMHDLQLSKYWTPTAAQVGVDAIKLRWSMRRSPSGDPKNDETFWIGGLYFGAEPLDNNPHIVQLHAISIMKDQHDEKQQSLLCWDIIEADLTVKRHLTGSERREFPKKVFRLTVPGSINDWHNIELEVLNGYPITIRHNKHNITDFHAFKQSFHNLPRIRINQPVGLITVGSSCEYKEIEAFFPLP